MGNRCLNYIFGYCLGEPERIGVEKEWQVTPGFSNKNTGILKKSETKCSKDKETCGKYSVEPSLVA